MIRKIKRILLCLTIAIVSLFGAVACSREPISIVLVDEYLREECIMNQEFDVTTVVENYNSKWKYKIKECFYLDNLDDLKRHDIPVVDNTKFTQTMPYEVHVVLTAEYAFQVTEKEFVLDVVISQNEMQKTLITCWSQTGVSKRMEGNPDFVYEGEKSSVKVTYLGSTLPGINDGIAIGSFVTNKDVSVTSWDNAVMTMQVYNPQPYDLQFGWMAGKNGGVYNDIGYFCDRTILKAGEWTEVNWSSVVLEL